MKLFLAIPLRPVLARPTSLVRTITCETYQFELDLLQRVLNYSIVGQLCGRFDSSYTTCDLIRLKEMLPEQACTMVYSRDQWHLLAGYVSHLIREHRRGGDLPGTRDTDLTNELMPLLFRMKFSIRQINFSL